MKEAYRKARAVFDLVFDGANASIFNNPELYDGIERFWIFRRSQLAEATASFIDEIVAGKSIILDLAAGTGMLTHALQKRGHCVTGFDLHIAMLKGMKSKSSETNPAAVVADMNKTFPFGDNSFDVVATLRANRFIQGDSFYKESHRMLRTNGLFVLPVFPIDRPFWWKEAGVKQHTTAKDIALDLRQIGFSDVQTIPGRTVLHGANIPPYYIPTYLVAKK